MQLRRLALLALLVTPVGVIWAACSVPSRPVDLTESTCVEGCPEVDASVGDASNSLSITPDSGSVSDGPVRNTTRCGPDNVPGSCTPDPTDATDPNDTANPAITTCSAAGVGLSCQVVRSTAQVGSTACGHVGNAKEGEACGGDTVSTDGLPESDCMAGLACVRPTDDAAFGQCQRYCCYNTCDEAGYYCIQRRFYDPIAAPDQFIPVCIKGDGCTLLDHGSCPNPNNESPAPVCQLVAARTTACGVPAKSAGPTCPCVEGYACLNATNTCRQLCHLGVDSDCTDDTSGVCVGGGDVLPPGFGLCVPG